jgi:diguanylate cyclase (GGDEF)-like protein/PAS domain S-box-containing protein
MPTSHSRLLARRATLSFLLLALLAAANAVVLWHVVGGTVAAHDPVGARQLRAASGGMLGLTLLTLVGLWTASVRPAIATVARAFREAQDGHARVAAQAEELERQNETLFRQREQLRRQAEELEATNATLFEQHDELERQAEALREAQELASAIVAGARDGIVAFDTRGRYTVWNPAMAQLYGVPADEVIGTTPAERFPDLATPAIRQAHAAALAGELVTQRGRRIEVGRGRPDGTPDVRWVDVAYTPLRAHDGRVIGGVGLLHDVTEARRAAEEVERLSTVVRQTDDAVAITDAHARLQWVNAAWERMTGWTLAEVRGRSPGHLLHGPDTDHETRLAMRAAVAAGASWAGEVLNYRRDGTPYWLALTITPLRDAAGELTSFVAIERDVTARRAEERERQRLATVVAITPDGVGVTDADGRFEYLNEAHAIIYGYGAPEALLGQPWTALHPPEEAARLARLAATALRGGGHWHGEAEGRRADGTSFPQELTLTQLPTGGVVCVVRDVTERKAQEELLRTWSLRDELTGLFNRRGFLATARERLAAAQGMEAPSVLLYLDLDDFKAINDAHGHDAGDAALVEMAGALRAAFRTTDVIGRLGGDEFVVLATHCPPSEAAGMRARLDAALARRNGRAGRLHALVASVGVATERAGARAARRDLDAMLRAADAALYAEKRHRKRARGAALVGA